MLNSVNVAVVGALFNVSQLLFCSVVVAAGLQRVLHTTGTSCQHSVSWPVRLSDLPPMQKG